ncbi:hypothetical protein [Actinoplanes sp. NPDC026619]|uniref:effector-associated constant component EACC1 n=1 Tax=Actinoplanes sp. NPDC026619 TaxID=3155798 RepID=UPI0033F07E21
MEARIVVHGTNTERVALWDWLFDDADLRDLLGRDASIEVDAAGEYVVLAEGPVAIWPVLARTLGAWIERWRATVTITGPAGRAVVSPGRAEAALRQVLGVREFSTPA